MEDSPWFLQTAVEKYYYFRLPVLKKIEVSNQIFIIMPTLENLIHLPCLILLHARSVASNFVAYSLPEYEWVHKLTAY